jgi:hypothetical protein
MRAFTVLSSLALLTLAAASAHAQSSSNPSTSASPSTSAPPAASTSQHSDRGYDSRAKKHPARKTDRSDTVVPGFAQTERPHSGNDAGYLVPFGPPA